MVVRAVLLERPALMFLKRPLAQAATMPGSWTRGLSEVFGGFLGGIIEASREPLGGLEAPRGHRGGLYGAFLGPLEASWGTLAGPLVRVHRYC